MENDLFAHDSETYSCEDLLAILRRLIGPDGCPWDKVQTHLTLRSNMIEEAYEAVDAIEKENLALLTEELGDVLLQVAFHAILAERDNEFTFDSITDQLCRKLIFRHSHVFGSDQADTPDAVLSVWEKNKQKEKGHTNHSQTLMDVPKGFPSLLRAEKIQKRAAKANFDWPDARGARDKITEELEEISCALSENQLPPYAKVSADEHPDAHNRVEGEIGDLLFSVVNYARLLGVNPEVALNRTNQKFITRFSQIEKMAQDQSKDLSSMSLDEMDELWNETKRWEQQ